MLYDCRTVADRDRGIAAAVEAAKSGELVVLPTDTVYGIGADAFTPHAIANLHTARGADRRVPPPVLVGSRHTLDGLVYALPKAARELADAFWPGALTLLVEHSPSLQWDLGETGGVVAVRMPLHPVALEVLREVGPMAVTTANKVGGPRRGPRRGPRAARILGPGLSGGGRGGRPGAQHDRRRHRRRATGAARRRGAVREAARCRAGHRCRGAGE
jgi:tRNA threonylcarbamoyl adenosine modification protein (Sua5/YciO/YrdC/YwlC family)